MTEITRAAIDSRYRRLFKRMRSCSSRQDNINERLDIVCDRTKQEHWRNLRKQLLKDRTKRDFVAQ